MIKQNSKIGIYKDDFKSLMREYLQTGIMIGKNYVLNLKHGLFESGHGVKLTNRKGSSLEFMEHRDYLAGDDLRQLDWNVYARTERLTVKLYREEINPTLDIIIDGSASMNLVNTQKLYTSLSLSSLIATAASNANYLTKIWSTDDGVHEIRHGINHDAIMQWSEELKFTSTLNPNEAFNFHHGVFQHNGVRIFISDLLFTGEPKHLLRRIGLNSSAVIILQILSEEDINPIVSNSTKIKDSETGEFTDILIDEVAIKKYKQAFANHQQNWEHCCKECGALLVTINAEEFQTEFSLEQFIKHEILRFV